MSTQRRQTEPGQTPTTVGILRPRPLPTSDSIIWEEAGLSPPSSVWVRTQTPTMRGGDAQIIPPNTEEQWKCADPKIKNHWKTKKDTYTHDMINGSKFFQIIVLFKRHLMETIHNKLLEKREKFPLFKHLLLLNVNGIKCRNETVLSRSFAASVYLKYPQKQFFLSCPVLSMLLFLVGIQWQMNKSLRQHVSDFCSRWRVKCPLCSHRALCSMYLWRSDWTFVIVFAAGRWRAGAGPAILCGKFRTGHEPAICISRPSAASSQTQKHFSYWRGFGGGRMMQISSTNVCYILEEKAFTSHDYTEAYGTFLWVSPLGGCYRKDKTNALTEMSICSCVWKSSKFPA